MRVVQIVLIQLELRLDDGKLLLQAFLSVRTTFRNLLRQLRDAILIRSYRRFLGLQALGDLPRFRRERSGTCRCILQRRRERRIHRIISQAQSFLSVAFFGAGFGELRQLFGCVKRARIHKRGLLLRSGSTHRAEPLAIISPVPRGDHCAKRCKREHG